MNRGVHHTDHRLYSHKGKPIRIIGISSSNRSEKGCAREDPVSKHYLELALRAAEKAGAKTQLIDLRELKISPCKECYSTCPAQCRFSEKTFQCDCYYFKSDYLLVDSRTAVPIEKAYDLLSKEQFFNIYHDAGRFGKQDDMWLVYRALMEADGVIFAASTQYYSRPALLQTMIGRLCALDGGVEKLWGDGKNLQNSVEYSKSPNAKYKQRLYGKWFAIINCSKEGDAVSPNLLKALTMMGMKSIPLGTAYHVSWYNDPTHRSDSRNAKADRYTLALVERIGREIVAAARTGPREYGIVNERV